MKVYATISTNIARAEIQDNEDETWTVIVTKNGVEMIQSFSTLEAAEEYANQAVK